MSEPDDVAITTVTCTLVMTSIVGNSLVCAVVVRNQEMRVPINYLLVNLATADIIYSIFMVPVLIMNFISTHPEGRTGEVLCSLLTDGTLAWVGASSSVVTLVAIALERYYAVIYPVGNKGKLTTRKLKVIIPGSWIFAFILQIPQFMNKKFDKNICPNFCIYTWSDMWAPKAYFLLWVAFFVISSALMTGLYLRVVYTLWIKPKDTGSFQQQGVLKSRKRVTLMVVTISVIFGICWGVDSVIHVMEDLASYNLGPLSVAIAHTMIMFNSAVNPFAYALISQRFREKMKKMICCRSFFKPKARIHPVKEPYHVGLANSMILRSIQQPNLPQKPTANSLAHRIEEKVKPATDHRDDAPINLADGFARPCCPD